MDKSIIISLGCHQSSYFKHLLHRFAIENCIMGNALAVNNIFEKKTDVDISVVTNTIEKKNDVDNVVNLFPNIHTVGYFKKVYADEIKILEDKMSHELKEATRAGLKVLKVLYKKALKENEENYNLKMIAEIEKNKIDVENDPMMEKKLEWAEIKDSLFREICASYIKDCEGQNSSVTSGAAIELFANKEEEIIDEDDGGVMILNCGTGDCKYQWYGGPKVAMRKAAVLGKDYKNGIVLLGEHKPKDETNPITTSRLNVGPYVYKHKPKGNKPMLPALSIQELALGIENELEKLPWTKSLGKIKIYALVTGTIRQEWEKADAEGKAVMDRALNQLFSSINFHGAKLEIHPWTGKRGNSYFIPQEVEGSFECLALQNLIRWTDPGADAIGSFGIGRGSAQWSIRVTDEAGTETTTVLGYNYGMNNPDKLKDIGSWLSKQLDDEKLTDGITRTLQKLNLAGKKPVFALKSGPLIGFNDEWKKLFIPDFTAPVRKIEKESQDTEKTKDL